MGQHHIHGMPNGEKYKTGKKHVGRKTRACLGGVSLTKKNRFLGPMTRSGSRSKTTPKAPHHHCLQQTTSHPLTQDAPPLETTLHAGGYETKHTSGKAINFLCAIWKKETGQGHSSVPHTGRFLFPKIQNVGSLRIPTDFSENQTNMQNSPIKTPHGDNFAPPDHSVCPDVDEHDNHTAPLDDKHIASSKNKHVDFDSTSDDDSSSSSSSLSSFDQNDQGEHFSVVCPLMAPSRGGRDDTHSYLHDLKSGVHYSGIDCLRMQEKWDFIRKHYYDIVSTCGMCPKYAETCRSVGDFLSDVSEKRSKGNCFTPIQPVKELYEWVQDHGIDIYFITMRSNKFSGTTQKLLKKNGFRGYRQLMMRPNSVQPSGQWKSMCRSKIGRPLLLNIGDKKTDLDSYGIDDAAACVSIRIPNIIEYIVG